MKVAVQFYTLRSFTTTPEGFRSALRRCAEIGFQSVQLSAVGAMDGDRPAVTAAQARVWLDELGLTCCATHRPWDRLKMSTAAEIEFHRTLGCDYTAIGGRFGKDAETSAQFARWCEEAAPVSAALAEAGIALGYHNHSHEWIRDSIGGRSGFDVLAAESSFPLQMEIDTYWVAHAGGSPATVLRSLPGRVRKIHVKDMEVVHGDGSVMAPVGEGNLDWRDILSAAREAGTEWLIIEQDECRRGPFDCLASSYRFLTNLLSDL